MYEKLIVPHVYIIDDDLSIRESLEDLLQSIDLNVKSFSSTKDFLSVVNDKTFGCILLDIRMPEQSGLNFQIQMNDLGIEIPVIFITGHGDVVMSVQAMKNGAIDFFMKPFNHQQLIDTIQYAIKKDEKRINNLKEKQQRYELWMSLSHGEQEVIKLVLQGNLNKQIADILNLSEITIKVRRASAMKKLNVKSTIKLVQILEDFL